MNTILVVNPTAGGGRAAASLRAVHDVLLAQGRDVTVVETMSADHAESVAAQADPNDVIVSLGGDGLHNRTASGALRSGALLAPIPGGRGNDLVRALGIPRHADDAAGALALATERRIDVGLAGERVFLGVASVGFDSVANNLANQARIISGAAVYAVAGARALLSAKSYRFTVTVDGQAAVFIGRNVAVGNSGRYGGGVRICPNAGLDDGLLDIVAAADIPRWELPAVLLRAFRGTHVNHPRVHTNRGRTITIEADSTLVVYADGDPIGVLPLTLTVIPGALRVLSRGSTACRHDCSGTA